MRRTDREITSADDILNIIGKAKILHLGLADDGYPYIVPMHYGFEMIDGTLVFYLHSATQGHKLDIIRQNPKVCAELECDVQLTGEGDIPCRYGSLYQSVMIRGKADILTEPEQKQHALKVLMRHQTGRDFEITGAMTETVAVIQIRVSDCTAKARKM